MFRRRRVVIIVIGKPVVVVVVVDDGGGGGGGGSHVDLDSKHAIYVFGSHLPEDPVTFVNHHDGYTDTDTDDEKDLSSMMVRMVDSSSSSFVHGFSYLGNVPSYTKYVDRSTIHLPTHTHSNHS